MFGGFSGQIGQAQYYIDRQPIDTANSCPETSLRAARPPDTQFISGSFGMEHHVTHV